MTKNALQRDGALILKAQLAAERLREMVEEADGAVTRMTSDELRLLARHLEDVAAIASRHHLVAAAGSLAPESFPPPTV